MILFHNLPVVVERSRASTAVLDVGGWFQPLCSATHVLDLAPYETRNRKAALDPDIAERFSAKTWIKWDACTAPWPFHNKSFDFSFCSHLLEDVRDPLTVCAELVRVSRAGYIETPSRLREIFAKDRLFALKAAVGRMPEIGFSHHRWFVELDGTHLRFTAKNLQIAMDRRRFLTRADLGRKLSAEESGVGLFWEGEFTFAEAHLPTADDLVAFRNRALAEVRSTRP